MLKHNPDEEEFNIWPTYSDVAFAIVLILVFILLGQFVVTLKTLEIDKIEKEQQLLSNRLKSTFPNQYGKSIQDIRQPQLQKIMFSDRILFDSGSDIIQHRGRAVLRNIANILSDLKKPIYQITEETVSNLQVQKFPDDLIKKVEKLSGIKGNNEKEFLKNINNSEIGMQIPVNYKSMILKYSKCMPSCFDEIHIRGHTDNIPIHNNKFASNWELSSARATSVVRFFDEVCGLRPENGLLISAQGYSEFDPIASNSNYTGRSLNRRIEIVIKYPLPF
ncbi:MAG: OmpA family protein [Candidatus Lokiarchaeota archaeon]|nr:OmpA family protein [Candidatus Lokiarchaeota archaeon]